MSSCTLWKRSPELPSKFRSHSAAVRKFGAKPIIFSNFLHFFIAMPQSVFPRAVLTLSETPVCHCWMFVKFRERKRASTLKAVLHQKGIQSSLFSVGMASSGSTSRWPSCRSFRFPSSILMVWMTISYAVFFDPSRLSSHSRL